MLAADGGAGSRPLAAHGIPEPVFSGLVMHVIQRFSSAPMISQEPRIGASPLKAMLNSTDHTSNAKTTRYLDDSQVWTA